MPAVPSNPESEKPLPLLFKRPVTLSRAMYSGKKKAAPGRIFHYIRLTEETGLYFGTG